MESTFEQTDQARQDAEYETVPPHLGNIAFWVSDFESMREFYSTILGVPEAGAGSVPHSWVFYAHGPFSFSLNQARFSPQDRGWNRCPMTPGNGDNWDPYMTFYVPDLAETIARCREAGIRMRTQEPFSLGEGFGWSIDVRDPDGNTVAITQR